MWGFQTVLQVWSMTEGASMRHSCQACGSEYRCGHSDCHHDNTYGGCTNECTGELLRTKSLDKCAQCQTDWKVGIKIPRPYGA